MKKSVFESIIIKKSMKVLAVGMILLVYGFIRYLFFAPNTGINLLTLQPTMIDGSISLILGIGFIIGGLYSLNYRQKLAKEKEIDLIQKKKELSNQPKWLKHR